MKNYVDSCTACIMKDAKLEMLQQELNIQNRREYHVHRPQYRVKRVPKIKQVKELDNESKESIRRCGKWGFQLEPWET